MAGFWSILRKEGKPTRLDEVPADWESPVDIPGLNDPPPGDGTDIGAYEEQAQFGALIVTTNSDELDPGFDPDDLSLREAINLANTNSGPDVIEFDTSGIFATPTTITLSLGELIISEEVIISGPGSSQLTVDAAGAKRTFALGWMPKTTLTSTPFGNISYTV